MSQAARHAESNELALLRTPGDWTRAHFAIYKPNVIYRATLNGVPSSTDMVGQVTFTHVSGTLANVKAEMTLWIGSATDERDLGTCRIRKAPVGSTIYIGYTSEIDWAGAATVYLTVVDHAMLRAKPVLNDAGVIKMDGEHAYDDNQHVLFDPVPVLSCHAVGTLVDGTVELAWDASNSWVFDSEIDTWLWEASGSLSIDDDESQTPVITYDTAGNHPVYCTVTALNGKSATGIQFAFIFDANNKPYEVEVQAPSASYDEGGYSFNVKMFADADPTEIIEGALCVLFAEDWYGTTKQSIGQMVNRENIICWGYIAGETIDWNAEISSVEFSVQGPHYWLNKIQADLTQLVFAVTPTGWGEMSALTVDRALWHMLHWRSNATALLNITLTGDIRYAPTVEAGGSLWSQMSEIAWNKIFGRLGCDRYGRFFAVIEPQCVPEGDRDWESVMTLTKKDWMESVNIPRSPQRKLSTLMLSGWAVNSSGAVVTLYSLAMGHIPAQYGEPEIIDKVLAESQEQLNELAGLYMGWKNNQLEFDFTLSQNNRMVDLWPNQFLDIALLAADTPRGIAYTGNLIPRSITLQPDPETGCWSTEISCEAETFAELNVNGDIPIGDDFPSTPDDIDWGGNIKFPKMPTIEPIPGGDPYGGLPPSRVLVHDVLHGMIYTSNFDEIDYTKIVWQQLNWGLIDTEYKAVFQLIFTPAGEVFIATPSDIFYAPSPNSAYTKVLSNAEIVAAFANDHPGQTCYVENMGINKGSGEIGVVISAVDNWRYSKFMLGGSGGFSLKTPTTAYSGHGTNLSYGSGKWVHTEIQTGGFGYHYAVRFTSAGVPIDGVQIGGAGAGGVWHWRIGSSASGFQRISTKIHRTTDNWATFDAGSTCLSNIFASDLSGQYLMGNNVADMYKSSDNGSSWSVMTKPASTIQVAWNQFCVDKDRWIIIGGASSAAYSPIIYTGDFNATPFELKHGNLSLLFPSQVLSWNLVQALP